MNNTNLFLSRFLLKTALIVSIFAGQTAFDVRATLAEDAIKLVTAKEKVEATITNATNVIDLCTILQKNGTDESDEIYKSMKTIAEINNTNEKENSPEGDQVLYISMQNAIDTLLITIQFKAIQLVTKEVQKIKEVKACTEINKSLIKQDSIAESLKKTTLHETAHTNAKAIIDAAKKGVFKDMLPEELLKDLFSRSIAIVNAINMTGACASISYIESIKNACKNLKEFAGSSIDGLMKNMKSFTETIISTITSAFSNTDSINGLKKHKTTNTNKKSVLNNV